MSQVEIVEVGLRDGLQNEAVVLSNAVRIEFGQRLIDSGLRRIEAGAFVRADRVPQMAGTKEVISGLLDYQKSKTPAKPAIISALIPNEKGMEEALAVRVKEIAIFAATSESFSKKNINCTIEESFQRFEPVIRAAKKNNIRVRGYLSTCFGCPYEGAISEAKVVKLARRLISLGCFEVSIGDTIGVATPNQVTSLFKKLKRHISAKKIAGHFHDTRGVALANILSAFNVGIHIFDTSLGGLGGCPYAPGAAGNVATEDVAYMFEGMKVKTGLRLEELITINKWLQGILGRPLPSKMANAGVFRALNKP